MLRRYVSFDLPGFLFPESSTIEIKDRKAKFEIPENAYAYQFYDVEETIVNGETLRGKAKNKSNRFLLINKGEIYDAESVRGQVKDSSILISNMKANGWNKVARTVAGNFQPILDTDTLIEQ